MTEWGPLLPILLLTGYPNVILYLNQKHNHTFIWFLQDIGFKYLLIGIILGITYRMGLIPYREPLGLTLLHSLWNPIDLTIMLIYLGGGFMALSYFMGWIDIDKEGYNETEGI